jgi:hypothetical protein
MRRRELRVKPKSAILVAGLSGLLLFWFMRQNGTPISSPKSVRATNPSTLSAPITATNESVTELRKLLNDDYHSGDLHDAITSALAHQLIAEQLRTNVAFLDWASNTTKSVILRFMARSGLSIYGATGLTADNLQLNKVTVNGLVGISAEAVYDPDPTNEGPLAIIVEGGVHPTILRVQNGFRLISYQLNPEYWEKGPRKIGRMDWSCAVRPLDTNQVSRLAHRAFREMTGLDLGSFHLEKSKIDVEGILNPNASHPEVTVTGNLNAKLYTPKDYLYPFAEFQYDDTSSAHPVHVTFSGEMVQTSPGRGEFVELFAVVRKTEAIFELGEEFLGQGTWEQAMLDNVRSLNTEQRGQVYRRIFQH